MIVIGGGGALSDLFLQPLPRARHGGMTGKTRSSAPATPPPSGLPPTSVEAATALECRFSFFALTAEEFGEEDAV